ncbi:enamine deaminase RidA (YjgF/YER057c/UK114 family) [Herbihabitans rhizosphaerae]|uniref:Enamine deaminase RidA (YjgF/YER057c/UK114 family) n=1 Tax=Herbihabitans rhizosphaerae TaxID=1872711 RepID=A0A4Q7KY97_9PSEU|nr:RidA family protein [Herbihabitans rhizosphaerae]RZS41001.1 enamine deaminase RidA (YjgF/YER057c/UK114 family) [Herbihabitans rhizosphaerae]
MKTFRDPDTVHAPVAGCTHQIEVSGSPRWLVLSGQLGQARDGSVPEDPGDQLALAVENVRHNLAAAGMTVDDLVKVTIYLTEQVDPARRREVLGEWLGGHKPCMTLVVVVALAAPQYKVEVDACACHLPTN